MGSHNYCLISSIHRGPNHKNHPPPKAAALSQQKLLETTGGFFFLIFGLKKRASHFFFSFPSVPIDRSIGTDVIWKLSFQIL